LRTRVRMFGDTQTQERRNPFAFGHMGDRGEVTPIGE